MRLGKVRLQIQYTAVPGDRFIQPARLMSDHAEKLDRIGLVRSDLEDLPINLLGSLQPAGLMVSEGDCQCFGNRGHMSAEGRYVSRGINAFIDYYLIIQSRRRQQDLAPANGCEPFGFKTSRRLKCATNFTMPIYPRLP